jgi:hypothetical protein
MGSTDDFLRLINEQNERIVAREVEKEASIDQVRLQRDQERRERWGQLRAREHPNKRPKQVHPVFGHVSLDR